MSIIWQLAMRNIKVYVRDRTSVFFSFLSVIIIIGLYALFLGRLQVDSIEATMKQFNLPTTGARFLVDSWIMAGLLAVNAVTIALGALGPMVFDVEQKRFNDFMVSPVSRTAVVISYLISSCIISFAFSLITFAAGELYILSSGGELLGLVNMLKVIAMLALTVLMSSSIMFLIATFLKTGSAFGTLSTLLGTLIGFITGVYVPVGVLPAAIQKFVALVPFSHSAALLRQVYCAEPLQNLFGKLPPAAMANYEKMYGIKLFWGAGEITIPIMLAVLAGVAALFLLLSALRLRRYKQA